MTIYRPAEDSFLMKEVLINELKDKNITCLEIGSGSGIQIRTLIDLGIKPENITLTDINPEAIINLKKEFSISKVINSDLFQKIKEDFDLIVFNPPYLPEDKREPKDSRLATTGGKEGSEIINRFLKEAKVHLTKEGKIFLLTSSLTKNINWEDWKKRKIGEKKIFMEELFVWELTI